LVSQTFSPTGWQLTKLRSQLDQASPQGSALQQAGNGHWHVELQDDKQQPLTLDGVLAFSVETENADTTESAVTAKVSGTLQGSGVEVALDTDVSGRTNPDSSSRSLHTVLKLTRSGQTNTIGLMQSDDTKNLAYGLSETRDRTVLQRDAIKDDSTRTITVRDFGGESEVWLKGMVGPGPGQPAVVSADMHFFQRATNRDLVNFYDRFDAEVAGKKFTLPSPGTVTTTPDGQIHSDLVMVDSQGKPVSHGAEKAPGLAAPLPNPNGAHAGLFELAGWAPRLAASPAAPSAYTCSNGALAVAAAAIVIGAVLALVAVAAVAAAPVSVVLVTAAGVAIVPTAAVSAGFITGVGLASIGASLAGVGTAVAGCNADPSFIVADIRSTDEQANAAPIQITRVSGGLLTAGAAPSPPAATVSGRSPGSLPRDGGAQHNPDRPENFVSGAVPSKATQLGAWIWDATRSYGAAPSHTQALADGPQQHYFLHAARPLALTADDNLIQYIYLDPQHPPVELYVQFYTGDGDGEHRAYWGDDRVQTGGKAGTASLYPMGPLPAAGGWVRLRVLADKLGLVGQRVNGILYGAYDGQTWWGPTTTSSRSLDPVADGATVDNPPVPPATLPGAQIAYRLAQPTRLTVEIANAGGAIVRTLLKEQDRPAGYQVAQWDGKDEHGTLVPDRPYQARFSVAGKVVAEHPVTITPFVATIQTPADSSLVRGNAVPVIGEAYGAMFSSYVLEYGQGAQPVVWKTITTSDAPVLLPKPRPSTVNPTGNLADWNVGINEFAPWTDAGLNGLYTLRLRVLGKDGREASDSVQIIVGRLAHSAEGGMIVSPDGKARLLIPPLATQNSFALMAILPLAQSDPSGTRGAAMPKDKKPAGAVYEILGADETFRRPATLELPYDAGTPPEKLGVLLGDGTPGGWRYLGGTADTKRQIVSVPVSEFGGKRALVAPFIADQFGPVQPYRPAGAPFAFSAPDAAPLVASSTHPVAFYSDLQSAPGEWQALDAFGTQLTRVTGADAGLPPGNAALKVTRLAGGARVVRVRSTPYDATKFPLIAFDYRLPPGYAPNVLLRSNGIWWQVGTGNSGDASSRYYQTVPAPALVADDGWHHYQLDALAYLRAGQPSDATFRVDEVVLGQYQSGLYMQVTPLDRGAIGSAYYLRNFTAFAPTTSTAPALTFAAPPGAAYSAYSVTLDTHSDTLPPTASPGSATSTQAHLPDGAADGLWYAHVRGQLANGAWSAPAHYPLLIDRQPPALARPDSTAGGAGSPNFIRLSASDAVSGLDLTSLRITLNGRPYGLGNGIDYDPATRLLAIRPFALQPSLPPVAAGELVAVSVLALADYAGNKVAAPFSWSFTTDQLKVTGQGFRALTTNGGSAPVLSPDGSRLAFVSSRSGKEKIWLMGAADYAEAAKSAAPLTGGTARETSPEWSPDGKSLAFVSEAGGAPQLWISGADGSNAHAVTAGTGAMTSPTWSPDGASLVFIADGNLRQVASDGSNAHALTALPDHPFQSVRWQPGGDLLAVHFKLYEDRIELYNMATGERQQLTHGGNEREPAWLNAATVLYTAPAGKGQPDAIWQSSLDGSNQMILPGSGQPGVDDAEAGAAASGDAVALVSTRGGKRDIWLQATLQVAQFDVEPASGAVPGEPQHIIYTLPAAAAVTLQVRKGGDIVRTLLDAAPQASGTQEVTWDGMDAARKALAPGDYTLELLAQVRGGGDPLVRYTTARLLDAANVGGLQLQIQQWGDQAATGSHPRVQVFAAGTLSGVVAEAAFTTAPLFKLPAGRYDVVVSFDGGRHVEQDVAVEAGQTRTHPIDLHLGELDVTVLSAPGQSVTENASVQVIPSGDPTGQAFSSYGGKGTFILAPGAYDLLTEYQGLRQTTVAVTVSAGQVTARAVNLDSGTLHMNVLASPGQSTTPGLLDVAVFAPGNHKDSIAEVGFTSSPVELHLPAGQYDVHVTYDVAADRPHIGGEIDIWNTGLVIEAGQTLTQDDNLGLGEVSISVLEATGKPADAGKLSFVIVHDGESDELHPVARALFLNAADLQLRPGKYGVIVDYGDTDLAKAGPVGTSFEIKEGQHTSDTVDFTLGRLRVEGYDAPGHLIDGSRLSFQVSPPGKPDDSSPSEQGDSVLGLPVAAGPRYDVLIELDEAWS
jgi:flagellar hook assembly protein FlgD